MAHSAHVTHIIINCYRAISNWQFSFRATRPLRATNIGYELRELTTSQFCETLLPILFAKSECRLFLLTIQYNDLYS